MNPKSEIVPSVKRHWLDLDTGTLLLANTLTAVFFIMGNGSILQVLWIFWIQSVIIGALNVARILSFGANRPSYLGTVSSRAFEYFLKFFFAGFFIIHYGAFHLGYAVFLAVFGSSRALFNGGPSPFTDVDRAVNVELVLVAGAVFAVHHIMTFAREKYQHYNGDIIRDLQQVMIKPYSRIIVMHACIIAGPFIAMGVGAKWIFIPFIVLKSFVDISLHIKGTGHNFYQPNETTVKTI